MSTGSKKISNLIHRDVLISFGIVVVIAILAFFGFFKKFDYRVYDMLMGLKPAAIERDDVVMVSIDNTSIAELGAFPWPRDIIADAIIRMRELGASSVTFDIEYLSPSALGIDPLVKDALPNNFTTAKQAVSSMVTELSQAVSQGMLPTEYLEDTTSSLLSENIEPEFNLLYQNIEHNLFRDNDLYFAKALSFFGNSWVTLNMTDMSIVPSDELMQFVKTNVLLTNISDPEGLIKKECNEYLKKSNSVKGITPTLYELIKQSSGAGFTNIVLDDDGTRRRVKLLFEVDGEYALQLVFAPIVKKLDIKSIVREKDKLILNDALFPGETVRRNIKIPLDENGNMLVNWIKDPFEKSFKNEPVLFLNQLDDFESTMIDIMKTLQSFRLRKSDGMMLSYYDAVSYLLSRYDDLKIKKEELLNDIDYEKVNITTTRENIAYDNYFADRKEFFIECGELCDKAYEAEILDYLPLAVSEDEAKDYAFWVSDKFSKYREYYQLYNEYNERMSDIFKDSFCIIGNTASASTDLGTTPFESKYANIGTHANVYNTIMEEQFITPLPWWIGIVTASFLLLGITFITRKTPVFWQNIINVLGILVIFVVIFSLMIFFNIYIDAIGPLLIMIFGFIALTILRFVSAEKDKSFLRRAFSTYLSGDVVDEIVNDPTKLTLGGEEKNLTAIFTDIRGFSTISEKVTPSQLVSFLNKYLTLLSDIILENRGTIDKYEGDAIIAFFGAPISFADHAWKACISAVRMKQAEEKFNVEMLASGIIPSPVCTRIGINTGNMVVGNMGTDMKMNYTMMGNAVNLAARLEGVNKVYHSWILVSESTWNAANSGEHAGILLARRFDRVRVVGINTPVQLYNILGVKSELPTELIESVKLFHAGLDCYFKKSFTDAKKLFNAASHTYPSDEAAAVFSARCDANIASGVPENWDGVVNMTSK